MDHVLWWQSKGALQSKSETRKPGGNQGEGTETSASCTLTMVAGKQVRDQKTRWKTPKEKEMEMTLVLCFS